MDYAWRIAAVLIRVGVALGAVKCEKPQVCAVRDVLAPA